MATDRSEMPGAFWMHSDDAERDDVRRALLIGTEASICELETRLTDSGIVVDPRHRILVSTEGGGDLTNWAQALEDAVRHGRPDLALVSLPARFSSLIAQLRLALRRRQIPDRFIPTLEDLLEGIGPRNLPDIDLETLLDRPCRPLDEERIEGLFRGRRVLVTGAGGSIGSELALRIASYGPAELVLMDRSEQALFEIDRRLARAHPAMPRKASLQDVADAAGTLRVFEACRPNLVLHAAAHKHVPLSEDHPREAVRNNIVGSLSAVDAAVAVGASTFVLVSTDKAVSPRSVMGATKRLAEVAVQRRAAEGGLATSVVRFGNVLGSSGSVLDIWKREIADGGPLTLTDRRMTRYLMTIPEAAGLVLQAASLASNLAPVGRVHVLDMGEPVRMLDLARRFVEANGLELNEGSALHGVSGAGAIGLVEVGARPGEKLSEILAHPGEALLPTSHPAIRTWDGVVPSTRIVDRLLGMVATNGSTSAEVLIEALRRAVSLLDGKSFNSSRATPSNSEVLLRVDRG